MTQQEYNKAYKERHKIKNIIINLPENTKRDFKTICAALDTDMSSIVRPEIEKFIKKNSNLLK